MIPKDSLFRKWYGCRLIVIEMLKFHMNREMMFTKKYAGSDKRITHKYTMCNSFDRFQTIQGSGQIFDVYHHLETLNTDIMPWDLKRQDKWNDFIKKKIYDYSIYEDERQWAFDIDAKGDILKAYNEAKKVQAYMWDCDIESSIIFSGSKGFHIDCMKNGPAVQVRRENKAVCNNLLKECPHLDKYIYGKRRAWRTPYSLHGETGLVCLPLGKRETDMLDLGQLQKFLRAMHPSRVWSDVKILRRGYAIAK